MELLLDRNFEKLWKLPSHDLVRLTENIIKKSSKLNNLLINIDFDKPENLREFISLLSDDITEITVFHSIISFLQFISDDPQVRKTSYTADILLTNYQNTLNLNRKLYDKIVDYYKKADNMNLLSDVDKEFLKKIVRTFRKNGIDLNDNNRDMLLKLSHEIAKIEIYMYRVFNIKKQDSIKLTKKESIGMPKSILNTTSVDIVNGEKVYKLELNDNTYSNIMRYINNNKIRQELEQYKNNQFKDNIENIARLLVLRNKKAKLLGYKNYSDFKSKYHMAKNSDNIKDFLNDLIVKLDYRFSKEMDTIKKIKAKESYDKNINSWDVDYYIVKWKKKYGLDGQYIKQFFPIDHVIKTIFEIYQELFMIKFERSHENNTWNSNVVNYNIYDVSKNNNKQLIGYLYLDLFQRTGKIKQTRSFILRPGSQYPLNKNKFQPTVMSLISYIEFNGDPKKTLLDHSDLVNLFHEMGHIMFHMLSKSKYSPLSGSNMEKDFIQTPSLTLDNLCWEPSILKRLSRHCETGQTLSDEIIRKMINIRNLNVGIHYKKIILSSIYDQFIHSSEGFIDMCETFLKIDDVNKKTATIKENFSNLYEQLHKKILKSSDSKDNSIEFNQGTLFPYNFENILIGDDALFYCIPWSRITASDIYNTKFKDISNLTKVGMDFRKHIFDNNGTLDSSQIVREYLGRDIQIDGFLELFDLETNADYSFFFNTDKINSSTNNNNSPTTTELILSENKNRVDEIVDDDYDSEMNRFSEINDEDLRFTESVGINKLRYIQNKIKMDNDVYMTENTESLKKYNNIFIKN